MAEIHKGIHWVGFIDWALRNFHGYSTPYGSTYNAYLIDDERPALIDTVKYYGFDEMVARIRAVIDPARIRYIISNHTEMDHSGSIERLLELAPQAEVVCSPQGKEALLRHFKKQWKCKVVANAEGLSLGKKTLKFYLTPMVHWPDSMATFLEGEGILFPNDAFGQHYASAERFADEVGPDIVLREATKYYANIVLPYGAQVLKALQALGTLDIRMICPSHGALWRRKQDIDTIVSHYTRWARYESQARAAIIYDTMWHSTEKMAHVLYTSLDKAGIPTTLSCLNTTHISDAMTDVMCSRAVLVGSPILNNNVVPSVAAFLAYMKGLKPKNRYGATFGSYGWSKAGFAELEGALTQAGITLAGEGKYFRYIPDAQELSTLEETARTLQSVIIKKP
jgi:flavorubredoxin